MLLEWMMNGHAILYTGVTLAFWSTILIVGKITFSLSVCLSVEINASESSAYSTVQNEPACIFAFCPGRKSFI